jgi:hypothetical protein
MRKAEWIALFISLAGVLAAFLVAVRVFHNFRIDTKVVTPF